MPSPGKPVDRVDVPGDQPLAEIVCRSHARAHHPFELAVCQLKSLSSRLPRATNALASGVSWLTSPGCWSPRRAGADQKRPRPEDPVPSHPLIDRVEVNAYTVPTDAPEEDGTLAWDATTIVVVHAHAGSERPRLHLRGRVDGEADREQAGRPGQGLDAPAPRRAWAAMVKAIRNLGRPGIASMAISAVDVALWDLHARLLDAPLCTVLGEPTTACPFTAREASPTTPTATAGAARGLGREGIPRVKMKIGAIPRRTARRVRCRARGDRDACRAVRRRQRRLRAQAGARAR